MRDTIRKIDKALCNLLLLIGEIALIAMTIIVITTVIMRFVFNTGNSWAEEVPRVFVSIFAFLACALGVRDHLHTQVTIIYDRLQEGGKGQKILSTLTNVIVLIVGLLMAIIGTITCVKLVNNGGILPMTGLPVVLSYISIPISGVCISFFCLEFLFGIVDEKETFFTKIDDDPMVQARKLLEAEEAARLAAEKKGE